MFVKLSDIMPLFLHTLTPFHFDPLSNLTTVVCPSIRRGPSIIHPRGMTSGCCGCAGGWSGRFVHGRVSGSEDREWWQLLQGWQLCSFWLAVAFQLLPSCLPHMIWHPGGQLISTFLCLALTAPMLCETISILFLDIFLSFNFAFNTPRSDSIAGAICFSAAYILGPLFGYKSIVFKNSGGYP